MSGSATSGKARFIRRSEGGAAVEFALVMPVFLMLMMGVFTYGWHLALVHSVQQLAAEAARSSIAGLNGPEQRALAESYVAHHAGAYPLIDPASLSTSAATDPLDANAFVVTLGYDASHSAIYAWPAFLPLPPRTIRRSASVLKGGY